MSDTFINKGDVFNAMSSLAMGASVRLKKKKSTKHISEIAKELSAPETEWKLPSQKADDSGDQWEFPRSQLKQTKPLGSGAFGVVYEAIATKIKPGQPSTKVAVKMLSDESSHAETAFFKEVAIMKALDGPHKIVRLLAVCTKEKPYLMVLELMAKGDLKTLLRDARPKPVSVLSLQELVRMGSDIAEGMAYLASVKIVHRDLAARNCLVDESFVVKIGDFGLTRDVYESDYYRMTGSAPLPVRWMSPEAIMDGVYTTQSDVWSFGVVMWELLSFAQIPYAGLSNMEVCEQIADDGLRLAMPKACTPEIYNVMLACWHDEAKKRPEFMDLSLYLSKLATTVSSEKIKTIVNTAKKNSRSELQAISDDFGYSDPQKQYVLRSELPPSSDQQLYTDQRNQGLSSFELALKVAKESQAVIDVTLPKGKLVTTSNVKAEEEYVVNPPTYSAPTARTKSVASPSKLSSFSPSARQDAPSPVKDDKNDQKTSVAYAKLAYENKADTLKSPTKTVAATPPPASPSSSSSSAAAGALAFERRQGSAQTLIGKFDQIVEEESLTPVYTLQKPTKVDATKLEEKLLANQAAISSDNEDAERVPPSPEAEQAIRVWLEAAGGLEIGDLEKSLKSGEVLCNLMNKIKPGAVAKYHQGSKMAFKQMENIGYFFGGVCDLRRAKI